MSFPGITNDDWNELNNRTLSSSLSSSSSQEKPDNIINVQVSKVLTSVDLNEEQLKYFKEKERVKSLGPKKRGRPSKKEEIIIPCEHLEMGSDAWLECYEVRDRRLRHVHNELVSLFLDYTILGLKLEHRPELYTFSFDKFKKWQGEYDDKCANSKDIEENDPLETYVSPMVYALRGAIIGAIFGLAQGILSIFL